MCACALHAPLACATLTCGWPSSCLTTRLYAYSPPGGASGPGTPHRPTSSARDQHTSPHTHRPAANLCTVRASVKQQQPLNTSRVVGRIAQKARALVCNHCSCGCVTHGSAWLASMQTHAVVRAEAAQLQVASNKATCMSWMSHCLHLPATLCAATYLVNAGSLINNNCTVICYAAGVPVTEAAVLLLPDAAQNSHCTAQHSILDQWQAQFPTRVLL